MKIVFHLEFLKPSKKTSQGFKSDASHALFSEYIRRIRKYVECETTSSLEGAPQSLGSSDALWLCDRGPGAKILSSEELSEKLRREIESSRKALRILVGGPNGFSPEFQKSIRPNLKWCFGPMTLPHELASVVAAEQLYRAWTILKKEPYHLGH